MARRREHPAVQAAMERTGITRELSGRLMRAIDSATADALKAEGLEAFRTALSRLDPTPQLLFQYADALLVTGHFDEALEAARRNSVPAYRALVEGRVFLARGEPERALERFSEGIADWPDHAVARYYAALAAEALGRIDRAIEEYRYSIRASPGGTDARLRLARLHLAENRPELALTAIQHDFANSPGDLETVLAELEILSRMGLAKRLPPRLSSRVQPRPVWGRAVAALAAGARARSGPDAALQVVEAADSLDLSEPESAPALESLVGDLIALDRVGEAVSRVQAVVEKRPDAAIFHVVHGDVLAARGDPEAARAAYRRALEIDPASPRALAAVASLDVAAGNPADALPALERAADAAPERPEYARALADALVALERKDEAEAVLAKLLARHATDARAALRLARLREERGAEREATVALVRRAARFGAGEEAQVLLARVQQGSQPDPADPLVRTPRD